MDSEEDHCLIIIAESKYYLLKIPMKFFWHFPWSLPHLHEVLYALFSVEFFTRTFYGVRHLFLGSPVHTFSEVLFHTFSCRVLTFSSKFPTRCIGEFIKHFKEVLPNFLIEFFLHISMKFFTPFPLSFFTHFYMELLTHVLVLHPFLSSSSHIGLWVSLHILRWKSYCSELFFMDFFAHFPGKFSFPSPSPLKT